MCGHAVIALGRWAVDTGRVPRREPETLVNIQCPCGLVRARVEFEDGKRRRRRVRERAGLRLRPRPSGGGAGLRYAGRRYRLWRRLLRRAAGRTLRPRRPPLAARAISSMPPTAVTEAVRAQMPLAHPDDPDLAFLYGTILTDGADRFEATADRQHLRLRRPRGRPQPDRQRRHRPHRRPACPGTDRGRARSATSKASPAPSSPAAPLPMCGRARIRP